MSAMNQLAESERIDSQWSGLYKIAGTSALIVVVLIPIQIAVFLMWPPPGFEPTSTVVTGYFALFQKSRLIALLDLDLLLIVDEALGIPIALALYVALRRANESLMLIATAIGLLVTSTYFASNAAFSMLPLSNQYSAATTDAQRSLLVASGQAVLAAHLGTGFHVNYVMGTIALAIAAIVILKSRVFSKATGYVGILASIVGLGLYVPKIGIALSILSVPLYAAWNTLIARKFFQLAEDVQPADENPLTV